MNGYGRTHRIINQGKNWRDLKTGDMLQGKTEPVEFQIESYLNYQGDKFSDFFDANSYILITKMLDYFDLAREYNHDPVAAFKHAQCKFLVISFSSDWRFSPARSEEITDALIAAGKDVYIAIDSDHFYCPISVISKRLELLVTTTRSSWSMNHKLHLKQWIEPGSWIFDVGCRWRSA